MLVELREPVLALGLGIVSSVGHDCHHDTQRRDDEIQLKGLLGLLPLIHGFVGSVPFGVVFHQRNMNGSLRFPRQLDR